MLDSITLVKKDINSLNGLRRPANPLANAVKPPLVPNSFFVKEPICPLRPNRVLEKFSPSLLSSSRAASCFLMASTEEACDLFCSWSILTSRLLLSSSASCVAVMPAMLCFFLSRAAIFFSICLITSSLRSEASSYAACSPEIASLSSLFFSLRSSMRSFSASLLNLSRSIFTVGSSAMINYS